MKTLRTTPSIPLSIAADYFAQDPCEDKLNLTVGIYQDDTGQTHQDYFWAQMQPTLRRLEVIFQLGSCFC